MSGARHTPGPWACHFGDESTTCDCRYILAEYGGMGSIADISVCEKMEGDWGDDIGPPADVAKANARLIAAAPDLLAALERFVAHYPNGINPMLDDAASAARAAIAKARGQS